MTTYTTEQLEESYRAATGVVHCQAILTNDFVGGQPADRAGVEMFVKHHLHIVDPTTAEEAVARILREEIGERDIAPEEGELKEKLSYAVNVCRRSSSGPWLGDWQMKACIKQAASRLKLFTNYKGVKGNFAEAGQVRAVGISLSQPKHPEQIHFVVPTPGGGYAPATTIFRKFQGRVSTPQGAKSIVHDSECVLAGSMFEFEFRFLPGPLKESDLADVIGLTMVVGLGSVRSLEYGKFRVLTCEVNVPKKSKEKEQVEVKPTTEPEAKVATAQ